jgi:hypothetical protein
LHFFLCSSFLAIFNSIPKAKSRSYTTHLNPSFKDASDANCENDTPIVNSWIRLQTKKIGRNQMFFGISKGTIVTL